MRDQYLWDRTGEPDPDVVRLERSLGALRHRHRALDYTRLPAARPARSPLWTFPRALLAAAASVIVLAGVAYWARPAPVPDAVPRLWAATSIEGAPRIDAGPLGGEVRLAAGGWVETDASSRARLSATGVGTIDVEPGTRVRVVKSAPGEHRLALIRGACARPHLGGAGPVLGGNAIGDGRRSGVQLPARGRRVGRRTPARHAGLGRSGRRWCRGARAARRDLPAAAGRGPRHSVL